MPLVSVLLTSYNHAQYLRESIDSVLNQTFSDFELLIADDASTDDSWAIIQSYSDPRIKPIRSPHNANYPITPEIIGAMRGKYMATHHSDDVWEKDKLEKQVAFLESHPDYIACFTWVNFIDENSQIYELTPENPYYGLFDQPNRPQAEWIRRLFAGNCLCHPSLLIRRAAYKKYNLFSSFGLVQLPITKSGCAWPSGKNFMCCQSG